MAYFLALDQGTSSSRALVFDERGGVCATARRELSVRYPRPGWVEQDAMDVWSTQRAAVEAALTDAEIDTRDVAAVGLANQRETTVIWERASGRPIAPAIVWQDRRTAAQCRSLEAQGLADMVTAKTGLRLDPYFSATKIGWILAHVDGARQRAERGELAFGTVDSWLVWNFTEGRVHATDVTNAARTLLFNIDTLDWDDALLDVFDVPRALLPEVRASAAHFGTTLLAGRTIDLIGVAGDQPAALLGQHCRAAGEVKNTYGTGAFVVMHTGGKRRDAEGLIAGPVCSLPGEAPVYGLEGSIFVAGALVQWLRDELGLIEQSADIEALAREVSDADGVMIVPAFAGLGAPFWDTAARGTILGLTRGTSAAHLARAALEAIAYRTRDVIDAMQATVGAPIRELRVDGGAATDDLLMQIQADVLGLPIARPRTTESTAMGAAMLAATGSGTLDAGALAQWRSPGERFEPQLATKARNAGYRQWRRACARAGDWAVDTDA